MGWECKNSVYSGESFDELFTHEVVYEEADDRVYSDYSDGVEAICLFNNQGSKTYLYSGQISNFNLIMV